jgi:hypothetical protein
MDMKKLYDVITHKNILEKYNLEHTFFSDPEKALDEETCLHEIIHIFVKYRLHFEEDYSDFGEFIDSKSGESIHYPEVSIETKNIKPPFITDYSNPLLNLLCFMKAYASLTYSYKGSFKHYFIDVFNVFYDIGTNNQ